MTLILAAIVFIGCFALAGFMGAPYVPILKRESKTLLDLSELKAGQTLIDLGAGDGRLLRQAAARGIRGIGYEINPVMYLISLVVCYRYRRLISLHLADLWHVTLPPADVVYVFLMPKFMERLKHKLESQLPPGTVVVSYAFPLPGWRAVRQNKNTFVYKVAPNADQL